MIWNERQMNMAQFANIKKNDEYHIFVMTSDTLTEKDLKVLSVLAPVKVFDRQGQAHLYNYTDVRELIESKYHNRKVYERISQNDELVKIFEHSPKVRELWTSANNVDEFIERCISYLEYNNTFYVVIHGEPYKFYYYDLRSSGEYIGTQPTKTTYKGRATYGQAVDYIDNVVSNARRVMLFEFYINNNFPFDDEPKRHLDLYGNPCLVLPVSACHPSVEQAMY